MNEPKSDEQLKQIRFLKSWYIVSEQELQLVPNRSIGIIAVFYKRFHLTIRSNGVLLSRNIVLTAASGVYKLQQQNQEYRQVKFYLPQKGIARCYEIQSIRYPSQHQLPQKNKSETQRLQYEYALLKLKEKVDYDEFPQIQPYCGKCLIDYNQHINLSIFGYPSIGDNCKALNELAGQFVLRQYGSTKKNAITFIKQWVIEHGFGICGSPMFINGKIIGVYISNYNIYNLGRFTQQKLCANIIRMCHQMKGESFKIRQPMECHHEHYSQKLQPLLMVSQFYKKQSEEKLQKEEKEEKLQKEEKEEKLQKEEKEEKLQKEEKEEKLQKEEKEEKLQKEEKEERVKDNIQQISHELSLRLRWQKLTDIYSKRIDKRLQLDLQTNNIKILDLNGYQVSQQFKLTAKEVAFFQKIHLPSLTDLLLDNNAIGDEGLQILCRVNFPELKRICLDDNAISINGLRYILVNNWSQKTKYSLYSVQSNDNGYYLHVGKYLPIMKKILNAKDMKEVDYLIPFEQSKDALNAMNLLLLTPLDDEDPKKFAYFSQDIYQNYIKRSSQDTYSLATVLVRLKTFLGSSLKFSEKPNIKSKLSSKIIFTGLLDERVRFNLKVKNFKDFHFSDFKCNHKSLLKFEVQYMEYLRKKYNVLTTDISLDKISEGSIIADSSDSFKNAFSRNQSFFQKVADEVTIFFHNLLLTEDQFDQRGNYKFPQIKLVEMQDRGGFPYYQPVLGKRFGIKVEDLYDQGNNDWLMMNGNSNQWAVAFHGVTYPTKGNKMRSIMNGRVQGKMLKQGINQVFRYSTCLKSDSIVDEGIYLSPYFLSCLLDYSDIEEGQKYHLVLQCRVKPKSVKIPQQKAEYWVINNREDLRPYGIILFTDQDIEKLDQNSYLPNKIHKNIYNDQFTRQTWQTVYKKLYQQFMDQ